MAQQGASLPATARQNSSILCTRAASLVAQVLVGYRTTTGITALEITCTDDFTETGDDGMACQPGVRLGKLLGSSVTQEYSNTNYTGVLINWSASITTLRLVRGDGSIGQYGMAAAGASASLACPPGMMVAGFTGVSAFSASTKTGNLLQLGLFCRRSE